MGPKNTFTVRSQICTCCWLLEDTSIEADLWCLIIEATCGYWAFKWSPPKEMCCEYKNTHQILKIYHKKVSESVSRSVVSNSLQPNAILQVRILEWVILPFSGDLPNPGIKPRSPALQEDSLPAEPQGKPKIRVGAYPFSSGSSQPRNQTGVSCIAGKFLPTEISGKP